MFLHALQQQHDGVELLPGSVVGPQRHNEVVQTIPCALRRHDDQFVFEAVGAGILEKGVVTSLGGEAKWLCRMTTMGGFKIKMARYLNPIPCPCAGSRKASFLEEGGTA